MPILEAINVSKAFGGTRALVGVSFAVDPGEVHALVGENGAGKSTLIKVFSGVFRPDSGRVVYQGRAVDIDSPRAAREMGIATLFQEPMLFPDLSAVDNLFIGREIVDRLGNVSYREEERRTVDLLAEVGLSEEFARRRVGDLSLGHVQLILIAKALAYSSKVIIFDEPTAILTQQETERLFAIIRRLRERGVAVIYISHRLEEIFQLADRVTVMRDGQIRGVFPVREVTQDRIVELMAGRELHRPADRAAPPLPDVVLEVKGLSRPGVFSDVSFELHRGEILGFFGLVGSGRSDVMQAIAGITPPGAGEVRLNGRPLARRSPVEALRAGVAYLPEDRKGQGLFRSLTVQYNLSVGILERLRRFRVFVDDHGERSTARSMVESLAIRLPHVLSPVDALSGGNQQKVVLGRWLGTDPVVLILDEPTRGVDVGAKDEIHRRIIKLAESGVSLIVVSSELPEVLKLSDRLVIMYEGRIAGVVDRSQATQEQVLRLAIGQSTVARGAS